MKSKNGGGGGRNNYQNSKRNKNPTRGPPGILIFCEVGREKKCISEGMEILNHYYNDSDNEKEDVDTNSNANGDGDDKVTKNMTLEEEIEMMKKEKKKAPFHVYDTGCRGSVFFMCSTKHCNVIVPRRQGQSQQQKENEEQESKNDTDGNEDKIDTSKEQTSEPNKDDSQNDSKRKLEDKTDAGTGKKQKTQEDDNENSTTTISTTTTTIVEPKPNLWDPIKTVQSIVHDIRNNDSSAPRSRFITKMIPMQASCYANVEEITATSRAVVEKFLMPHGIQFANDNNNDDTTPPSATTGGSDGDNDDGSTVTKKATLPSFKIEFRKRFCSHLKREEVINIVADTVDALTKDYWNDKTEDKEDKEQVGTTATSTKYPPLFNVNLSSPDYTVIIEICKTLCIMSIVKDAQSYQNFNLMKIQGIEVQ